MDYFYKPSNEHFGLKSITKIFMSEIVAPLFTFSALTFIEQHTLVGEHNCFLIFNNFNGKEKTDPSFLYTVTKLSQHCKGQNCCKKFEIIKNTKKKIYLFSIII